MSGRTPTPRFRPADAGRGYALNSLCHSLASQAARQAFLSDEEAYCRRFHLTAEQREAVRRRDVTALIAFGGAVEHLSLLPS